MEAEAGAGYRFVEWTGDCSGSEATIQVDAQSNLSCVAIFAEGAEECSPADFDISIQVSTAGGELVEPSEEGVYAFDFATYRFDASATLTPSAQLFKWAVVIEGDEAASDFGVMFEHNFFSTPRPGHIELEVTRCDGTKQNAVYPFVIGRR